MTSVHAARESEQDSGSIVLEPLSLAGAYRLRLNPACDERGFFARRFCSEQFRQLGLATDFVQRSISFNAKRGTIRGLHFQASPATETKIIRCTRGAAFDVIVDLRTGSASYGQWHGEEINEDNRVMLYVPRGFAHGFQTLDDQTEIDYEITPAYLPAAARGVRFNDPLLGIKWPIYDAIVSPRDRSLPLLAAIDPL
jgi:dTDP-4-dehydrorhamnose 3,5-epimerase